MHTRIFLIGFMGSGKSTLGHQLARKLGFQHVDMDRLIEETAGMTIPGIFREYGETVFRKWEKDILIELCKREKVVISTGGGAPCHSDLIGIMNQNGTTIYIELSPEVLRTRLVHSKTERPLIKGKSEPELLAFITGKLKEREPFYRKAKYTIDGTSMNAADLVTLLNE
jgi:shikimate kinase